MIDVPAFADFCEHITIPSKDEGLVPLRLWGPQRYWLAEVNAGMERGVREFVTLKGRQLGMTTIMDAFRLYWPQVNSGTQGMFVSDNEPNRDYRRDLTLEMYGSLPRDYQRPVRVNNQNLLAWEKGEGFGGSRLMFDHSGLPRGGGQRRNRLGRSRGLNFFDGDEIGSWVNQADVSTVRASLSKVHPNRLYLWNSTAQGFGPFHEMVETAKDAVAQRLIFVAWWRHERYRVERTNESVWDKYGGRLTTDEKRWTREIKKLYSVEIEPEQVVWYRWTCDEDFMGDETMLAQEHPCLPEDAFQSFGDKFIPPHVIRRLNIEVKDAPRPIGYTYEPGNTLDGTRTETAPASTAPLKVWVEPVDDGAYIVSGHPWGSSSPDATEWVAQVWRAWPDEMELCAEYTLERGGTTQGFAWLLLILAGHYRRLARPWIICEANGPGYAVMKHLSLMESLGFGLSAMARRSGLQDIMSSVNRYFWYKPDNLGGKSAPLDFKNEPGVTPYLLHMLADAVIQGQLVIHSPHLIDALAMLRRGESGDNDQIGGLSVASAFCAAMAVRCWQDYAMLDLEYQIPKRADANATPRSMTEVVAGTFLHSVLTRGRR